MRRAGTLALVIAWVHAREEAIAAEGTPEHAARMDVFRPLTSELHERGVALTGLSAALDADGRRA